MKRLIVAGTLLLSSALLNAAEDNKVTFVAADQVAKGGSLATAPNLSITVAHRGSFSCHDATPFPPDSSSPPGCSSELSGYTELFTCRVAS